MTAINNFSKRKIRYIQLVNKARASKPIVKNLPLVIRLVENVSKKILKMHNFVGFFFLRYGNRKKNMHH